MITAQDSISPFPLNEVIQTFNPRTTEQNDDIDIWFRRQKKTPDIINFFSLWIYVNTVKPSWEFSPKTNITMVRT